LFSSTVIYSPTATTASTVFDPATGTWITTVPAWFRDEVFLSGRSFLVPSPGLPGGIKPVTWSGDVVTSATGVSVEWRWAAAVYTQLASDHAAIAVKPVEGDRVSPYRNCDRAGTPENFKRYVIAGARGGGWWNYTGSATGRERVAPCREFHDPSPAGG